MKAKEIRDLIDFISASGLEEVNIETEEFKISVKRNLPQATLPASASAAAPQLVQASPAPAATTPAPKEEAPAPPATDDNLITVKSPMIGTFYRSSNPETPAFVEVGSSITKGDSVCIIEAMKLFNEIESEISGKVVKVLVDDATPVEYDQPLFLVDPS